MSDTPYRSDFEKLVISRKYIKSLKEENRVLKELVLQEKAERLEEQKDFIQVRNQILKASKPERLKIQVSEEVKLWKKRGKILSEKIDRLEAQNNQLKRNFDNAITELSKVKTLKYNIQKENEDLRQKLIDSGIEEPAIKTSYRGA